MRLTRREGAREIRRRGGFWSRANKPTRRRRFWLQLLHLKLHWNTIRGACQTLQRVGYRRVGIGGVSSGPSIR